MKTKLIPAIVAALSLSTPMLASAADVVKLSSATTAQGSDVMIDASNGVKINDAMVVKADVMTANGIIHAIDTVLMPK